MKKLAIVALLVLVGSAVYFFLPKADSEENKKGPEFKSVEAREGPLQVVISAKGVVEPNFDVEVKSKASGRVTLFKFEEGDRVKEGQLLLQLDKSDERRNVARAQADLQSSIAKRKKAESALLMQKTKYESDLRFAQSQVEEAEANLKDAHDKMKRQEDLFQQRVVARESLETAQTNYLVNQEILVQAKAKLVAANDAIHDIALKENEIELAEAEVKRSQIALDEAEDKLEETEIFAPITGVITEKLVQQGQIISSGISNVSGGTALAKIADLSRLYITADVDETDIGSIRTGQKVLITADAFPGESFDGVIKRIAPQGIVENSITLFKVKIEILGKGKSKLKPIMSANVEIITKYAKDTIYLPREAVWKEDDNYYAGLVENGEPKKTRVYPGFKNLTQVQMLEGVKKGQKVFVGDWEKYQAEKNKDKGKMSTVSRILWIIRSR